MQEPRYIIIRCWTNSVMQEALDAGLALEDGRAFRLAFNETSGAHDVIPLDPTVWDAHRRIAAAQRRAAADKLIAESAAAASDDTDAPAL